jgi:antitoxin component YwqK of YwqJK toxin-antitoxin module
MEVAMKWFLLLLVIFAYATPAMSQSERKVLIKGEFGLDTYEVYYASGELKERVTVLDGQRHGDYRFYSQDGELRIMTEYKNGKESGIRRVFDDNGQIIAAIRYVEGKKMQITVPFGDLKEALARKNDR